MALITSENAREMAKLAIEVRRANALKPPVEPIPKPEPDRERARALVRVEKQIARLDDLLDNPKLEPTGWRDLTMARERLHKIWSHLADIPNPGNLKPTAKRRAVSSSSSAEPAPE